MKEIHVGNLFGTTDIPEDIELLKKYNNECFTLNNYKVLAKHFEDKNARCLLPYILEITKIKENKVKYVKMTYFNTNSHHANLCATKITNSLTYIGLGNTLGTSEYGIYFGMDTGILFSKQICHLIGAIGEN